MNLLHSGGYSRRALSGSFCVYSQFGQGEIRRVRLSADSPSRLASRPGAVASIVNGNPCVGGAGASGQVGAVETAPFPACSHGRGRPPRCRSSKNGWIGLEHPTLALRVITRVELRREGSAKCGLDPCEGAVGAPSGLRHAPAVLSDECPHAACTSRTAEARVILSGSGPPRPSGVN